MPAIAGHELPTPGNADSPKQRKHREEVIVLGTVVLVVLTFVLVMRHGTSSASGLGSPASPTDQGSTTPDSNIPLPGMIAGIPGQVAALEQGNVNRQNKQLANLRKRMAALNKRLQQQARRNRQQAAKISTLQHEMNHPKAPSKPIHVTHRTRSPQHHGKGKEHFVGVAVHPPQHGGKKAQPQVLRWGSLYKETLKPAR